MVELRARIFNPDNTIIELTGKIMNQPMINPFLNPLMIQYKPFQAKPKNLLAKIQNFLLLINNIEFRLIDNRLVTAVDAFHHIGDRIEDVFDADEVYYFY